ncbi:MAG: helix-turn-helix transcriptional regulator [Oscillospiraceae bacterium]|nr:helix-turn-helix transcriptional regulator [Oscillospiraceae bacterium]
MVEHLSEKRMEKNMRIDYNKLLKARNAKGLKLSEAAREIGVPPTILRRWEKGIGKSPFESGRMTYPIENLLRLYQISIEELYYDKDIERLHKTFDFFDVNTEKIK